MPVQGDSIITPGRSKTLRDARPLQQYTLYNKQLSRNSTNKLIKKKIVTSNSKFFTIHRWVSEEKKNKPDKNYGNRDILVKSWAIIVEDLIGTHIN